MRGVAALNALPEIKDRTRLIIGDALSANLQLCLFLPVLEGGLDRRFDFYEF